MRVLVSKAKRRLWVLDNSREVMQAGIALGREPVGHKVCFGDGKTPEGIYHICLVKEKGKYGKSLGIDYPGVADAERALADGRIDREAYESICAAHTENRRPPWGTALGGEIFLHEGGTAGDWTQGCIALEPETMEQLFSLWEELESVEILPE